MKEWFIIFLTFLCSGAARCETLPSVEERETRAFNAENNPIIHAYMKNYADRLYNAFDTRKLNYVDTCQSAKYILYKDGTISEPKSIFTKKYYEHAKSTVENTLPSPFPQGMNVAQVNMDVWFCKAKYDEIRFQYYTYDSHFYISIDKDYRKRKLKK